MAGGSESQDGGGAGSSARRGPKHPERAVQAPPVADQHHRVAGPIGSFGLPLVDGPAVADHGDLDRAGSLPEVEGGGGFAERRGGRFDLHQLQGVVDAEMLQGVEAQIGMGTAPEDAVVFGPGRTRVPARCG